MPDATPADLATNLELRLAYCPLLGRLWRTSAEGAPIRELKLWRRAEGRLKIGTILVGQKYKMLTHVIYYIMVGRWLLPNYVIDHIDGDPSNNAWSNLREATLSQNNGNADRSHTRWNGRDELIEGGVKKTRNGTYAVTVCGVWYGTYRSRTEANELARRIRREVKGTFDIPFVTSRRIIRGTAP
jgi:hypothetical protein